MQNTPDNPEAARSLTLTDEDADSADESLVPTLADVANMAHCELIGLSAMFTLQTRFVYRGREVMLTKPELWGNMLATIRTGKRPADFKFREDYNNVGPLTESSLVLFHEYKPNNREVATLMQRLTDGQFKFDNWSRDLLRESWRVDRPLTYRQFADAYVANKLDKSSARKAKQVPKGRFSTMSVYVYARYRMLKATGDTLYQPMRLF